MARKKTGSRSASRDERFDDVLAELGARFPGKIMRASEFTAPWTLRRCPTGLLNLDIALNGGLPAGGMSMFVAKPNMGKNWLLLQVIRQQQLIYGDDARFAIIGTEMAFDKSQARTAGVKVAFSEEEIAAEDRSVRVQRKGKGLTAAEIDDLRTQIGKFVVIPPSTAERSFEMCAELVAANAFNVIAIDSFGAVLTEGDSDKSLEESARVGGAAGLNTRLMHKLNNSFAPNASGEPNMTCLIGTNQVRDNLKAQAFMKQQKESGGWALKHGRFVTIELIRTGWLTRTKSDKTRIGKQMRWEITKQKAGGHDGHAGDYLFYFDGLRFDRADMDLDMALGSGLIIKSGNTYTYEGIKIGVGRAKAAAFLAEKEDLLNELESEIMRLHGVSYRL